MPFTIVLHNAKLCAVPEEAHRLPCFRKDNTRFGVSTYRPKLGANLCRAMDTVACRLPLRIGYLQKTPQGEPQKFLGVRRMRRHKRQFAFEPRNLGIVCCEKLCVCIFLTSQHCFDFTHLRVCRRFATHGIDKHAKTMCAFVAIRKIDNDTFEGAVCTNKTFVHCCGRCRGQDKHMSSVAESECINETDERERHRIALPCTFRAKEFDVRHNEACRLRTLRRETSQCCHYFVCIRHLCASCCLHLCARFFERVVTAFCFRLHSQCFLQRFVTCFKTKPVRKTQAGRRERARNCFCKIEKLRARRIHFGIQVLRIPRQEDRLFSRGERGFECGLPLD